ncbi:cyclic AMP-responsive element-binding protein 3 [Erinaceus europaeus]|uniref:Cyclic AMP-responsive element-binding protein 3 n=1 Tax=Erinaceus europaeus TaxID=9365 RepID=A0A1S3WAV1_ERIEU|nr:cyclic AMP-responsive element-binding protein 3 [Erinaceus europaeus]
MDLALDPGDQDLLNFLLEESGDLGAAPGGAAEAPPAWEPSLSDVESDWDVEDFLSFLSSPAPASSSSLNSLNSCNSCLVDHDHTYSLPLEPVSIDRDGGNHREGIPMASLSVEEAGEQQMPRLVLTDEEQRLLQKEGLVLPRTLPLTKMEEQVLKGVRRKIRNKRSAQESRRKKQVYVGGLESRVLKYTAQNLELQNKVQLLEEQNLSLLDQLRRLQATAMQMAKSGSSSSSSTCVLVLLFSVCLLLIPAMYSSNTRGSLPAEYAALSRKLRALPSVNTHQLERPAWRSGTPKDSAVAVLAAPANFCCLLYHVPQVSGEEPSLASPLPDLSSEIPRSGPTLALHVNLTREGVAPSPQHHTCHSVGQMLKRDRKMWETSAKIWRPQSVSK